MPYFLVRNAGSLRNVEYIKMHKYSRTQMRLFPISRFFRHLFRFRQRSSLPKSLILSTSREADGAARARHTIRTFSSTLLPPCSNHLQPPPSKVAMRGVRDMFKVMPGRNSLDEQNPDQATPSRRIMESFHVANHSIFSS